MPRHAPLCAHVLPANLGAIRLHCVPRALARNPILANSRGPTTELPATSEAVVSRLRAAGFDGTGGGASAIEPSLLLAAPLGTPPCSAPRCPLGSSPAGQAPAGRPGRSDARAPSRRAAPGATATRATQRSSPSCGPPSAPSASARFGPCPADARGLVSLSGLAGLLGYEQGAGIKKNVFKTININLKNKL